MFGLGGRGERVITAAAAGVKPVRSRGGPLAIRAPPSGRRGTVVGCPRQTDAAIPDRSCSRRARGTTRVTHVILYGRSALPGRITLRYALANRWKERRVLHAAFNVALMLYCHDKKLPHPGFVVLDTPLLTYREPMDEKHGDLADDELAIKTTSLNKRFSAHLAGIAAIGQVIVLENTDPPADIEPLGAVTTFTKRVGGDTRYGFLTVDWPP